MNAMPAIALRSEAIRRSAPSQRVVAWGLTGSASPVTNPPLNAVITLDEEGARQRPKGQRTLDGLPSAAHYESVGSKPCRDKQRCRMWLTGGAVMSQEELLAAFAEGRLSRRDFIKKVAIAGGALGLSLGAVQEAAHADHVTLPDAAQKKASKKTPKKAAKKSAKKATPPSHSPE